MLKEITGKFVIWITTPYSCESFFQSVAKVQGVLFAPFLLSLTSSAVDENEGKLAVLFYS